jgi:putative endonuclease
MASSRELGAWGEEKAARYLEQKGYRIVERNFRSRFGEIDLVVEDEKFLVFVEVRLRKSSYFGLPEETVDQRKQHKLRLTAEFYLQRHPTNKQPRFDVVALYADKGMDTRPLPVKQIKNAF